MLLGIGSRRETTTRPPYSRLPYGAGKDTNTHTHSMRKERGRDAPPFAAPPSRPGSTGATGNAATEHGLLLTTIFTVATGQAVVKYIDGCFLLGLDNQPASTNLCQPAGDNGARTSPLPPTLRQEPPSQQLASGWRVLAKSRNTVRP